METVGRYLVILVAAVALSASAASALTLFDSQDQPIGEVVQSNFPLDSETVWVSFRRDSATYMLRFSRTAVYAESYIEYEGEGCTGKMGIRTPPWKVEESLLWDAAIAPPGSTVYISRKATPVFRMQVRSMWSHELQECFPVGSNEEAWMSEVLAGEDLSHQFTPPYIIK